jgi:hypothetical protein
MLKTRSSVRGVPGVALAALGLALGGCSAGVIAASPSGGGAQTGVSGAGGTPSNVNPAGTGGFFLTTLPSSAASAGGASGGTTEIVPCTDGEGCDCSALSVAVIGKPGKWGADPNGDSDTALQEWLNSSSAGTAKVDNYTAKPTLTPDFLAPYGVIILASLSDDSLTGPFWTFGDSEVAAMQDWVENKGGGLITLTSYTGDGREVNPTNQLIAFSGISYNMDGIYATCVDWRVCGCAHSNTLSTFNRTDPVIANLSNNVTWVGLDNGRSINAPADAHVAATVDGPKNALVGKLAGKGHVLVYADEWITYTSQWTGQGNSSENDPTCAGFLPEEDYQIAQFWYNMLKWSQPSATCFKIVDVQQPVVTW